MSDKYKVENKVDYKFEVITDNESVEKYIEYDKDRIFDLLRVCFDIDDTKKHIVNDLKDNIIFLCKTVNDNKLVGIATVVMYDHYVRTKEKIKTYNPLIYTSRKKFDDEGKLEIYKEDSQNAKIEYDFSTLYPCIYSLCKDKSYKAVGKFLLDNICNYYKKDEWTKVYLVPESSRHRNQMLNTKIVDEQFNKFLDKYNDDQKILIKYYQENNFVVSNEYYSMEKIKLNEKEFDGDHIIFYHIMVRNL